MTVQHNGTPESAPATQRRDIMQHNASRREEITGWRFWIVDPGPHGDGALLGPCKGEEWGSRDSRDFEARCLNPEHAPPVQSCGCGVYGWENAVDTRLWMRRTHAYGVLGR